MGFNFPQEPLPPTDYDRDLAGLLKPVSERCLSLEGTLLGLEQEFYRAIWSTSLEESITILKNHLSESEKNDVEWIRIHLEPIVPRKPHQKVSWAVCTSTQKKYQRLVNNLRYKAEASLRGGLSDDDFKHIMSVNDEKKREEMYHHLWINGISSYFTTFYQLFSPNNTTSAQGIPVVSGIIASYLSVPHRGRKKSSKGTN